MSKQEKNDTRDENIFEGKKKNHLSSRGCKYEESGPTNRKTCQRSRSERELQDVAFGNELPPRCPLPVL